MFRPEVQALRAVAVLLVVVYHLYPNRVAGGYVGVDVFFVISGFLITTHLLRDVERRNRVALAQFWARRARRLLPASLLVALASAVGVYAFVPQVLWQSFFREIGAGSLYVENWSLAIQSVDYLGRDALPSPVQHYWSLSVEEQFYLVWPLLIAVGVLIARRVGRLSRQRAILLLVLATFTASIVHSIVLTVSSPDVAYFATTTRAWEFAAGGLLAVFVTSDFRGRSAVRSALAWCGYAGIVVSALVYTSATPFPGWTAILPVAATGAVIVAGAPADPWSPTGLARTLPVQFFGGVSYSLYLWHWPLIIVLPYALGHSLTTVDKAGIAVSSVLLAWATKRFVEDPGRTAQLFVGHRPRRTFVAVIGATAAVALTAGAGWAVVQTQIDSASRLHVDPQRASQQCYGANALVSGANCADPFRLPGGFQPTVLQQDKGRGIIGRFYRSDSCLQDGRGAEPIRCAIGDADARLTIALVGDSHGGQLIEPLDLAGKQHHWRIETFLKGGCMPSTPDFVSGAKDLVEVESCHEFGRTAMREVESDSAVSVVMFAGLTDLYRTPQNTVDEPITARSLADAFQPVLDVGKRVVVVRDTPIVAPGGASPLCLAQNLTVYDPCSTPSILTAPDLTFDAVALLGPDARVLDDTDALCDQSRCHAVVGQVPVYTDTTHLSAAFASSLYPVMGSRILGELRDWGLDG